mmetsp:Transcript_38464/g.58547  ORF Transcript_38464/g.58547 Transcript_38464/m.58547 type:complete len:80 (+) Transcript_38464:584-823(+)
MPPSQASDQLLFQGLPLPEYGSQAMSSPPAGTPLTYDNTGLCQDFDRQKKAYEKKIRELKTQLKLQIEASSRESRKMKN